MDKYLRVMIFIWELPQILLAGIILVFLRKRFTVQETFYNSKIFYVKNFPGGISLGRFIILNAGYTKNESVLRHEYGHSIQSLYLGWFYLIIVGLPSITRSIIWRLFKLNKSDYYKGYPENWANKLGFPGEKHVEIL
jgi:hypothetical protein